jgi:hypothetical protein
VNIGPNDFRPPERPLVRPIHRIECLHVGGALLDNAAPCIALASFGGLGAARTQNAPTRHLWPSWRLSNRADRALPTWLAERQLRKLSVWRSVAPYT